MGNPEIPVQPHRYGMYIDGKQRGFKIDDDIHIEYPLTGEQWASVPEGTPSIVDKAVSNSFDRYTSDSWDSLTASARGELLFDIADAIENNVDELARLETLGNGMLLSSTRAQLESIPDYFRYYGGLADKVSGRTPESKDDSLFTFTRREPYGVVGAITSWNAPLKLATYKIAPALAAGNTVVVKPSELSPVSTIRFAEIATEAGLPPGALNVVTGFGDVGKTLTEHDKVQKVSFTGGLETGKKVGASAGETISSAVLELGGKSPNIVFPDADLEKAIDGAIGAIFAPSGQSCVAGSRLFLHESIHDEFVEKLVSKLSGLTVGNPFDSDTDLPPIATDEQFEKVKQYVQIGENEGGTLETGGKPINQEGRKNLFPPTVFTDIENQMRIAQEEIFGPVLSVIRFDSESEVVKQANDTKYGLAAGIWTGDMDRALRLSEKIEAGTIWINTYREHAFEAPFGGYKKSGVGREKGIEGINEYLQPKSVRIKKEVE